MIKTLSSLRLERLRKAASRGGKRRQELYGNFGTNEGRMKGAKISQERQKALGKGQNIPRVIKEPSETIELAEFVGIIAGDGHLSEYQVVVSTNSITDIQHAEFIAQLGNRLFGVIPKITALPNRKTMTIVFSSRAMVIFLREKGLLVGNKVKQNLRVPQWILQNEDLSTEFLRGVFDTDGSVYLDNHRIKHKIYPHIGWQFTSAIPDFLSDIASILRRRGYRFSHSSERVNIQMRKLSHIEKYFQDIGSHNEKHIARFIEFKETQRRGDRVVEGTALEKLHT